jgi:hypothetical protein
MKKNQKKQKIVEKAMFVKKFNLSYDYKVFL